MTITKLQFNTKQELLKHIKQNRSTNDWLCLIAQLGDHEITIKLYNKYLQVFNINGRPASNSSYFDTVKQLMIELDNGMDIL